MAQTDGPAVPNAPRAPNERGVEDVLGFALIWGVSLWAIARSLGPG